jgi:hypothetical protein
MPSLRHLRFQLVAVALAVIGAAALGGGCASNAGLVNMWRDPAYQEPPMHSVLVVAMRRTPVYRRTLEDGFVRELGKRGVEATPSYRLFPNAPPDTSDVEGAVSSHGYDGVLMITKLRTETSDRYVPGYVTTQPVTRVSPWTGRYRTRWVDVTHPGYVEKDVTVRHNIELWDMRREGAMVWTADGEVVNPSSPGEVNHDIAHNVVPELERQGFIPKKR